MKNKSNRFVYSTPSECAGNDGQVSVYFVAESEDMLVLEQKDEHAENGKFHSIFLTISELRNIAAASEQLQYELIHGTKYRSIDEK